MKLSSVFSRTGAPALSQPAATTTHSLGADIRALRRTRGVTLAQMAERLGVSIGWLSQVERDKSRPDAPAIEAIAGMLNVPTSVFIDTAPKSSEAGRVVRATTRRSIGSRVLGLTEELLSPDLTDDFEMVHSVFAPGAAITVPVTRATQEVAYLVSGKLDVTIAGETYKLGPGDSFRIRGEPYTWSNPYSSKCIAVWVIAPPVY